MTTGKNARNSTESNSTLPTTLVWVRGAFYLFPLCRTLYYLLKEYLVITYRIVNNSIIPTNFYLKSIENFGVSVKNFLKKHFHDSSCCPATKLMIISFRVHGNSIPINVYGKVRDDDASLPYSVPNPHLWSMRRAFMKLSRMFPFCSITTSISRPKYFRCEYSTGCNCRTMTNL